jgi:hypothetical protein
VVSADSSVSLLMASSTNGRLPKNKHKLKRVDDDTPSPKRYADPDSTLDVPRSANFDSSNLTVVETECVSHMTSCWSCDCHVIRTSTEQKITVD